MLIFDLPQIPAKYDPGEYMGLVYTDRMRTSSDKTRMCALYEDIFKSKPYEPTGQVNITTGLVQVGHSFLSRKDTVDAQGVRRQLSMLHHIIATLESLMKCIEMRYMTLLVSIHVYVCCACMHVYGNCSECYNIHLI
jgi:midasin